MQEIRKIRHPIGYSLLERQDPAVERLPGVDHSLRERIELQDQVVDPQPGLDAEVDPDRRQQVGEHPGEAATVKIGVQAHEFTP